MKIKILVFLVLISFCSVAQVDTTKVIEYNIKGVKSNYRVWSAYEFLFAGCNNTIIIATKGENRISEVKATNGAVFKTKKDSVFLLTKLIPGTTLITIYERGLDGKNKIIANQKFEVIDYPKLYFNGIKSDSVISKILLCGGSFYTEYAKAEIRVDVSKFKMDILENNGFVTDSSDGNRLSKRMRMYVSTLKEGSIVILKDIEYLSLDGQKKTAAVFRLFLAKEEKPPLKYGM
ncbi:MAG: hypothetical protein WCK02_14530 [Bacteroidota bacterium]